MNGFSGMSAQRFLISTTEAMSRASEVHNLNPLEGVPEGKVTPPRLRTPTNQRPPFPIESAMGGKHMVGIGNSTNIVVNQGVYDNVLRMLDMSDEQSGEDIYRIAVAIEEMCASTFIVPETVPRVMSITSQIKGLLGEFRSLTEDACIQTRKFVNEIRQIDQAEDSFEFVLNERLASDAVNRVVNAGKQQSSHMENTAKQYRAQAESFRDQARQHESRVASIENQIERIEGQILKLENQKRRPFNGFQFDGFHNSSAGFNNF